MGSSWRSEEGPRHRWTAVRRALFPAAMGVVCLALGGCVASGGIRAVYGYPVVEVDTVPVTIVSYPRTVYRGSYAYLVDGQWYYRDRGRWVIFRREPQELVRFRVDYHRRTRSHRPPAETREHRR